MSFNFMCLPGELRNKIYELVLVYQEPIRELLPGLLFTNRAIRHEASSIFYNQNQFHLLNLYPGQVACFLDNMGSKNAGLIQHIIIEFPEFDNWTSGALVLNDDSVNLINKLKSNCTSLRTITTSLYNAVGWKMAVHEREDDFTINTMKFVDAYWGGIPSLESIVLYTRNCGSDERVKRELGGLGRKVILREGKIASGYRAEEARKRRFDMLAALMRSVPF
ncbi:hypothetical protein CMQ_2399 [Grosmannia clavigera kw1407]|uniref:Uncharacterized protein n=1 Tax=Grosmannia clavigera (strain kw1407 / UAMH 11150) TaxID=655863 RepID=F0XJT7_GROCL|nr:uncharacterized protein CMQ_2399 [Grosmannia clavigera kw1407]EFX02350.1 hypothetical protein CMQ_2399 [Grosmannia clavigera kw1407]